MTSFQGTSFQGTIRATYAELVHAFGMSDDGADSNTWDKSTCHWTLQLEDGSIATIYDWKIMGDTPRQPYNWHVGGYSPAALRKVQKIFNYHLRTPKK